MLLSGAITPILPRKNVYQSLNSTLPKVDTADPQQKPSAEAPSETEEVSASQSVSGDSSWMSSASVSLPKLEDSSSDMSSGSEELLASVSETYLEHEQHIPSQSGEETIDDTIICRRIDSGMCTDNADKNFSIGTEDKSPVYRNSPRLRGRCLSENLCVSYSEKSPVDVESPHTCSEMKHDDPCKRNNSNPTLNRQHLEGTKSDGAIASSVVQHNKQNVSLMKRPRVLAPLYPETYSGKDDTRPAMKVRNSCSPFETFRHRAMLMSKNLDDMMLRECLTTDYEPGYNSRQIFNRLGLSMGDSSSVKSTESPNVMYEKSQTLFPSKLPHNVESHSNHSQSTFIIENDQNTRERLESIHKTLMAESKSSDDCPKLQIPSDDQSSANLPSANNIIENNNSPKRAFGNKPRRKHSRRKAKSPLPLKLHSQNIESLRDTQLLHQNRQIASKKVVIPRISEKKMYCRRPTPRSKVSGDDDSLISIKIKNKEGKIATSTLNSTTDTETNKPTSAKTRKSFAAGHKVSKKRRKSKTFYPTLQDDDHWRESLKRAIDKLSEIKSKNTFSFNRSIKKSKTSIIPKQTYPFVAGGRAKSFNVKLGPCEMPESDSRIQVVPQGRQPFIRVPSGKSVLRKVEITGHFSLPDPSKQRGINQSRKDSVRTAEETRLLKYRPNKAFTARCLLTHGCAKIKDIMKPKIEEKTPTVIKPKKRPKCQYEKSQEVMRF